MPKPKNVEPPSPPECPREPMGSAPALLAKRPIVKMNVWCPRNIEFDPMCDEDNPKTILPREVYKAYPVIRSEIPVTPLVRSKCCVQLGMEVNYKLEFFNRSHSFHERAAYYVLQNLSDEQKRNGIFTASTGSWGKALAYKARHSSVPVTVVFPEHTAPEYMNKIHAYGATAVRHGKNISEAKRHAFVMINDQGCGTYINGYDHPQVIAAAGTIGLEILEQLPDTEAILIPVGGGALLAGIATVVKQLRPEVMIYGLEPKTCCCFYKAMENERPYKTENGFSIANSLAVQTAGWNAYHTAVSLIDKMVLTRDDWITQAILHLAEEEKMVVDGAGAIAVSPLFSKPMVLPELLGKTIVCILTGSNMDNFTFRSAMERALAIDGRIIKLIIKLREVDMKTRLKVYSMIANMRVNILGSYNEPASLLENDLENIYEDFDEFCDPENPRIIKQEDVIDAANRMRPFIVYTPCVPSHCQKNFAIQLYYKLETLQASGSFKERGCLNALQLLPLDKRKLGVVVASLGNEAAGVCYHANKMNVPVFVIMPITVTISKMQKFHSLGAKVLIQGNNLMESQKYARSLARDRGMTFINCRDHPHVLAGYGSVAVEILEQVPSVDAVILPVGSGGLAAAVSSVIKQIKPSCLVYGVQPECNAGFFKALEIEEAIVTPVSPTLADATAVPNIGVNAFANTLPLLDKMLLVNEDWIARSVLHLMERERYVVEGAGACPLAAIIGNLVPEFKLKTVVCILTGGNVDSIMFPRCLERGLTAEGRLVKFSVGVKDTTAAKCRILDLLNDGGYNLVGEFQNREWMDNDYYTMEIRLVAQTRDLEHALELKRIIEKAYPCSAMFETEPFNDRRTCPCYVRKSMT